MMCFKAVKGWGVGKRRNSPREVVALNRREIGSVIPLLTRVTGWRPAPSYALACDFGQKEVKLARSQ